MQVIKISDPRGLYPVQFSVGEKGIQALREAGYQITSSSQHGVDLRILCDDDDHNPGQLKRHAEAIDGGRRSSLPPLKRRDWHDF